MKWISVKDKLPENTNKARDIYYLVYGKAIGDKWDSVKTEGYEVMPATWGYGSFSTVDYPAYLEIEVTHWMPLPEKPE